MQFGNVYITINFNIAYCQKIREVQETEKKNEIWSNFDDLVHINIRDEKPTYFFMS